MRYFFELRIRSETFVFIGGEVLGECSSSTEARRAPVNHESR